MLINPVPLEPIPDSTSTAQEVVATQNQPIPKPEDVDPTKKKIYDEWKTRIESCKNYRRKLVPQWTASIDMRRAKSYASQNDDEDRVTVPLDWSLTKTKQASLYSQTPQVRVSHPPATLSAPWFHSYEQRVNDTLVTAGIEACMDEVLPDTINASGFGAAIIVHEAITEDVQIPSTDMALLPPEIHAQVLQTGLMPDGTPVQMDTVPRVIDHRYTVSRISPSDFLWPINFTGSNFESAPWVGRSGRITWAQAVQKYNLTDEDKTSILGGDEKPSTDRLNHDHDKDKSSADEMVGFDEIFYRTHQYDSSARSYLAINHLVFIHGKQIPVLDEPWKGQEVKRDPDGTEKLLGSVKFPIQVLTLSYITDETIPPSDSAIGRYQINEINKARSQMQMQRERSLPVRWVDVNRVDPTIQHSLMRGRWQAMIPVQGNGTNILGEVARATMPQENFTFDRVAKSDLTELWSLGPNQTGGGTGIDTKGEAEIVESNYQTRIGRERAKVGKFFCSVAEVLGGLLALYEPPESFGEGFDPAISTTLTYSILADSTVLLDANQRIKRLVDFVNFGAKSGWVNIEPVMKEIASLSGLDPNQVIVPPQPKPPVEPSISLRLTGSEDMVNPITLAFLIKSGQAPTPEHVEQAKSLITMTVAPPPLPGPTMFDPNGIPIPQTPSGPQINLVPSAPPAPNAPPIPSPAPPRVGEANPDWNLMSTVGKRSDL